MNNKVTFKSAISLGAHCCVGYQINRIYGKRFSGPFEWTVSPFESVIKTIREKAENISIELRGISDGTSAVDNHYGICFHHEFIRDQNEKILFSAESIRNCRSKMLHKWDRMRRHLREGPVLFVRYGTYKEDAVAFVGSLENRGMRHSDLNRLTQAIDQLEPSLNYRIAYVTHPEIWGDMVADASLDPRFDVHQMAWSHGLPWTGDDAMWNDILSQYMLVG